jgi:hypothetical protein
MTLVSFAGVSYNRLSNGSKVIYQVGRQVIIGGRKISELAVEIDTSYLKDPAVTSDVLFKSYIAAVLKATPDTNIYTAMNDAYDRSIRGLVKFDQEIVTPEAANTAVYATLPDRKESRSNEARFSYNC